MSAIDDNDLILHHYRDGLDAARHAEIDVALRKSPTLQARYQRLLATLATADAVEITPRGGFEERLWRALDPVVNARAVRSPGWLKRLRAWTAVPPPLWVGATAFAIVCAVAVGFFAGRRSAPPVESVAGMQAQPMATRMLDAYVSEHLRATEGLLMTAVNSSVPPAADEHVLASQLVESNRLYALAATRAGKTRLADFLRQLEPVLIELANRPASESVQEIEGLRDYVRRTDLLFEVRATEARIDTAGKRRL